MFANGGKNNERPVQRTIGWTDTAGALFLRRFRFEFELRDFGGGGGRFFFLFRESRRKNRIAKYDDRNDHHRGCRAIDNVPDM